MRQPFYDILREAYEGKRLVSISIDPDDPHTHRVGFIWGLSETTFSYQAISEEAKFVGLTLVEGRRLYHLSVQTPYLVELQEGLSGSFAECPVFSGMNVPDSFPEALRATCALGEMVVLDLKYGGTEKTVFEMRGRMLSVSESIFVLDEYTAEGVYDGISYGLTKNIFSLSVLPSEQA